MSTFVYVCIGDARENGDILSCRRACVLYLQRYVFYLSVSDRRESPSMAVVYTHRDETPPFA